MPQLVIEAEVKSDRLGGVDVPSAEVLTEMRDSQYILHARGGELKRVPVERILLPHDQPTNPQAVDLIRAPDGTLYAGTGNLICKSTDSGRTWTSHARALEPKAFFMQVLEDGSFIAMSSEGEHPHSRVVFVSSNDEGRSWRKISEIPNPSPKHWGGAIYLEKLADGALLAGIGHPSHVFEDIKGRLVLKSGESEMYVYRSEDGANSWSDPVAVHDWCSEGDVSMTPSGKLIAAHRYQRPVLPEDPPDIEKQTESTSPGWPYKHVMTVESSDQGRSWQNPRFLTTVFGQTHGSIVALSDGTVIVVHDTRYGPGPAGSRAMISYDEGENWEDEVYYLDHTVFVGSYADSIVLEDDLVLSLVASSEADNTWEAVKNKTDHYLIRWRPEKSD